MTTVANIRGFRGVLADARLIDRSTPYGNPFRVAARGILAQIGPERQRVILEHRVWWYHPDQRLLRERARLELTGRTLLCHCSPLACHGDTIAGYLNLVVPFYETLPCQQSHTWTMHVDADPEYGTLCDCGGKRWGVNSVTVH